MTQPQGWDIHRLYARGNNEDPGKKLSTDDQIRSIENRLTSLDQERTALLNDLKNLRSQRDSQKSVVLLGRPTLMKAPDFE